MESIPSAPIASLAYASCYRLGSASPPTRLMLHRRTYWCFQGRPELGRANNAEAGGTRRKCSVEGSWFEWVYRRMWNSLVQACSWAGVWQHPSCLRVLSCASCVVWVAAIRFITLFHGLLIHKAHIHRAQEEEEERKRLNCI